MVEAIDAGLASNPDNVKRAERVFPRSEWDFLTYMAAPEYTYTRFLRAIGKFPAFFVLNILMAETQMRFVSAQ
ncbi:hypothetical protein QW180_05120 [Vibrio sinaloensis]|nr:hypothetical protein [Vibrio sinaloensis]